MKLEIKNLTLKYEFKRTIFFYQILYIIFSCPALNKKKQKKEKARKIKSQEHTQTATPPPSASAAPK